ncbi:MAG: hypothetical protein ABIR96_09615, partial [Bdellovibrionota bacterium]
MDKDKFFKIRSRALATPRVSILLENFLKDFLIFSWIWAAATQVPNLILSSLLAAPAVAVLMFRNFSLMHDAVHGSAMSRRPL